MIRMKASEALAAFQYSEALKARGKQGPNRTSAPDHSIEQYCTTSNTSDDFLLRFGESIPLQVRDVLQAARSEWVMMMQHFRPYEHDSDDQSSELMKCIQKIISMECTHKESMEERAGLQPSPLSRLKILFSRALTARLHEDLAYTKELREITLATIQASLSADMQDRLKHCFHCKKELQKGRARCSHCKFAGYCGEDCQKKDWWNHKQLCERIQKAKRKPTADEVFRALVVMNEELQVQPFVVPLHKHFHIVLGKGTEGYLHRDVRMMFKSRQAIVFVVYPKVEAEPSLFWEPFETTPTQGYRHAGQAKLSEVSGVTMEEEDIDLMECCQCGGLPNLFNSNPECLHLFCTDCVASSHLRKTCRECNQKFGTLILVSKRTRKGVLPTVPETGFRPFSQVERKANRLAFNSKRTALHLIREAA